MNDHELSKIVDFVESKDFVFFDTCFLYGGVVSVFPIFRHEFKKSEKEFGLIKMMVDNLNHTVDLLKRDNCHITCRVSSELDYHANLTHKKYSPFVDDMPELQEIVDRMLSLSELGYSKIRMPDNGKNYSFVLNQIMRASEKVKGSLFDRRADSFADEEIVATGLCKALSTGLDVGICSSDNHVRRLLDYGRDKFTGNAKCSCDLYLLI